LDRAISADVTAAYGPEAYPTGKSQTNPDREACTMYDAANELSIHDMPATRSKITALEQVAPVHDIRIPNLWPAFLPAQNAYPLLL
jgi:hypothetical protein